MEGEDKGIENFKSRSKSPEINVKIKRGNFILRQELRKINPECSPKCGILVNSVLMVLLLSLGVTILIMSQNILEYKIPYTSCSKYSLYKNRHVCNFTLSINSTMKSPVYFYYQLENFYTNNRDFVKSKIWSQLRGETHIVK